MTLPFEMKPEETFIGKPDRESAIFTTASVLHSGLYDLLVLYGPARFPSYKQTLTFIVSHINGRRRSFPMEIVHRYDDDGHESAKVSATLR